MSEQLKFFKGFETNLPQRDQIQVGALYHCVDTNNTYLGVGDFLIEVPISGSIEQKSSMTKGSFDALQLINSLD